MATTQALTLKFFKGTEIHTGYKRLIRLAEGKFIESVSDSRGSSFTWVLTKKGFEVIKPKLPSLKEDGFKSENSEHDLLVSAIHLGDFLIQKPDHIALVSEQELRRVAPESIPAWIPNASLHRPDGYYGIRDERNGIKTIALEVESSLKRRSDYEVVAEFYNSQDSITQALWFVHKWSQVEKLSNVFNQHSKRQVHSFLLLDDFVQTGSNAKIGLGFHQGKSMRNCLGNYLGTLSELIPVHPMLNTRKSPHRSKTCSSIPTLEITDRLRTQHTQKSVTKDIPIGGIHESLEASG